METNEQNARQQLEAYYEKHATLQLDELQKKMTRAAAESEARRQRGLDALEQNYAARRNSEAAKHEKTLYNIREQYQRVINELQSQIRKAYQYVLENKRQTQLRENYQAQTQMRLQSVYEETRTQQKRYESLQYTNYSLRYEIEQLDRYTSERNHLNQNLMLIKEAINRVYIDIMQAYQRLENMCYFYQLRGYSSAFETHSMIAKAAK